MKRNTIIIILDFLLVVLFMYSGVSKWLDLERFRGDMRNQPFPLWMADTLVAVLPTLEIVIALSLLFDPVKRYALYAYLVLMSLFSLYAILILAHVFPYVPCGCGGVIRSLHWPQHLVLNLFYVGIIIYDLFLIRKQINAGRQTSYKPA